MSYPANKKSIKRQRCDSFVLLYQAGVKSGQLASAVVGTINVLGTVVAASLMDKFGRKQLLSTSFSGMGLAMLSMAAGKSQFPRLPLEFWKSDS